MDSGCCCGWAKLLEQWRASSPDLLMWAVEGEKRVQLQLIQLSVNVSLLSGQELCKLVVDRTCTVELLKHRIQSETDIPQTRRINDKVCECILERHDFREAGAHDQSGLTALHCAASRGHLGAALVLVGSGAFTVVNSAYAQIDRNGVGWSARDIAATWTKPCAAEAAGEGDEKEETSKSAKYFMKPHYNSIRSKRSAEEDADATAFDAAAGRPARR
ncbi:hypothetical protein AK812_SmicGene23711 [Symbiodinium microadriaticum]|uniref:Uncharacterized protein n=1 Tax=Symbiodinium microadriaticum TaxID=2951 RepID=A0A1Q9DGJ4_SYMMI|nr:hypothetical protein AK812_SmicGene23711 [Symbiodinium microadriaticum]